MPLFLIAPLAAVGVFLLKVVVAAGYLVTGQWAAAAQDGEPGTAVVVVAEPTGEEGDMGDMRLALADGRTFTGRLVFADTRIADRFDDIVERRTRNPISGMVQPPRHRRRPSSKTVAFAELADAGGASIRCAFFADRSDEAAGLCTDDHGRWFDLARVATAPNAG